VCKKLLKKFPTVWEKISENFRGYFLTHTVEWGGRLPFHACPLKVQLPQTIWHQLGAYGYAVRRTKHLLIVNCRIYREQINDYGSGCLKTCDITV